MQGTFEPSYAGSTASSDPPGFRSTSSPHSLANSTNTASATPRIAGTVLPRPRVVTARRLRAVPRPVSILLASVLAWACGDDPTAEQTAEPRNAEPAADPAPDEEAPAAQPPEPEPAPAPAPATITIGHVDARDALLLQHLYWMPPQYMLGREPTLVLTGTVRELAKMKPRGRKLQGAPRFVFEARVEIDRVVHGTLEHAFVVVELADGLEVGDKLVVYAHQHEGKLGLIEAKGSNTRVGLEVAEWSDPIIAVLAATLDGTADLADPAIADAWRPFGEPAIQCHLDGRAVAKCD